jgi:hypothetical protein
MKRSVVAALVLAAVGFAAAHASGASRTSPLLGGWVQVVAYSDSDVRICPDYAILLASSAGAPSFCSTGLPVVGVQTDALTNHSTDPNESWGYLYLTGIYADGTFRVSSQSTTNQTGPEPPFLVTPPCPRPRRGWRLVLPTDVQFRAITRYERHHRHDVTHLEMFDKGDVATIASTHPRRARRALAGAWPRQLCVVRSHYTMSVFRQAQSEMRALVVVGANADYGWVSGGGGSAGTNSGQPATSLDALIETPDLSAILDKQPPGLVVFDAVLHPVAPT